MNEYSAITTRILYDVAAIGIYAEFDTIYRIPGDRHLEKVSGFDEKIEKCPFQNVYAIVSITEIITLLLSRRRKSRNDIFQTEFAVRLL